MIFETFEPRIVLAGSVQLVKDIYAGPVDSDPEYMTEMGGVVYFAAEHSHLNRELWRTDGTEGGTWQVKDIRTTPDQNSNYGSDVKYLTNVNGMLYFSADDNVSGVELWKSDGTAGGTSLVKDIFPGTGGASPQFLTNVNGTLFFKGFTPANNFELWKSDGTPEGTQLVKDIWPGGSGSDPANLIEYNGKLLFRAYDGTNPGLWSSDGTPAGTVLLRSFQSSFGFGNDNALVKVGGFVYFAASNAATGLELWKTDGTPAGTTLVKDFTPGTASSTISSLTAFKDTLYFSTRNSATGTELWKIDQATGDFVLVKDLVPGAGSSSPRSLTAVGNQLYFAARDATSAVDLWVSDGTGLGTYRLLDLNPTMGRDPQNLVSFQGKVFFRGTEPAAGPELWTSDGTGTGTYLVGDFNPGPAQSFPQTLTPIGDTLYFTPAFVPAYGQELWAYRENTNDPPEITSDGGGDSASVEVAENTTAVTTVVAVDPNAGDTITYSISGGADQLLFDIDPDSGVLTFLTAPDFETPSSAADSNEYVVVVTASDDPAGAGNALGMADIIDVFGNGFQVDVDVPAVFAGDYAVIDSTIYYISIAYGHSPFGGAGLDSFDIYTTNPDGTQGAYQNTSVDFLGQTVTFFDTFADAQAGASGGGLSDSQTITVHVTNVNEAPELATIGDKSINEQATLSFTATATDQDLPGQTLIYSLNAAALALGMSINSSTGAFTWTPTEAQGGASYSATITVTDNGTNPANLTDNETITINVAEVNVAPELSAIGTRNVDEQAVLTFTTTATDQDVPAQTLTYTLNAAAVALGMTINPNSGVFSWTPTEAQGGASYSATIMVTDNGVNPPSLTDSETITINVAEVNVAPVLGTIGARNVNEQSTLIFTAAATDQDLPAQTLTYSLNAAAFALGMTINPSTGAFSWTPTESQGGASYSATITVTDNGVSPPNLTDSETITISVADMAGAIVPIQDPLRGEWILQVFGTTGNDTIHIKPANDPNAVRVSVNGVNQDFVVTGPGAPVIARFVVFGDAGNDVIQMSQQANLFGIPAELRGGAGDDNIRGGVGPDIIFGEAGNDLLVGNEGRDLLVGGTGADRIVGNEEDDILISGNTDYDQNIVAMDTIFDEWRSARTYVQRVTNIRSGSLNGGYYLANDGPTANVHDDGVEDTLTGDSGFDWFFANLLLDMGDNSATKDKIKDLTAAEFADDLDFILNGI